MLEQKKKPSRFKAVIAVVSISIAIPVALAIRSSVHNPVPSSTVSTSAIQSAGTMPPNETFLKGGLLQRKLRGDEKPQEYIDVETGTKDPRYLKRSFAVHADRMISVILRNHSKVGHSENWVLVKPGSSRHVRAEAAQTAPIWNGIPETSDILAVVPETKAGQSTIRMFRSPSKPGNYPFLCTLYGRGIAMHGVLHVVD